MRENFFFFICVVLSAVPALDVLGQAKTGSPRILIAYFSWAENTQEFVERGTDAVSSASAHTRTIAQRIHQRVGGDLVGVRTVTPYSSNYNAVLAAALTELRARAWPPIRTNITDIAKYDVVFLGYPNWWATIPMSVATFLETHDLSGKTIVPFCSHGGGRLGQSVSDIAELVPNSTITRGLSITYGVWWFPR